MKKLFTLSVFLLLTLFSYSQYSAGARLGMNMSTITGRYSENDEMKKGWVGGLVFGFVGNYQFTDVISLDAELLFSTMGGKFKYTYDEGDGDGERVQQADEMEDIFTERFHYLQMPVMAKFTFGSDFKFYGIIGPYFGYALGGHYKYDQWGNESKGKIKFKEGSSGSSDVLYLDPDDNRRFDLGFNLGGGVGKEIGPGNLEAELRLGIGFLDHNKFDSKDDKPEGYKAFRNFCIGITVAYSYDFSK
jgi:hypothetical protein